MELLRQALLQPIKTIMKENKMIKCKDCNKEIGSEATKCPHCNTTTKYGHGQTAKIAGGACIGFGIAIFIGFNVILTNSDHVTLMNVIGGLLVIIGIINIVRGKAI